LICCFNQDAIVFNENYRITMVNDLLKNSD
jgi:hypothetical protein